MAWTLNPNYTNPSRDILSNHLMGQGGKVKSFIWGQWCRQSSHKKWRHDAKPRLYKWQYVIPQKRWDKSGLQITVVDQWHFTRILYNEWNRGCHCWQYSKHGSGNEKDKIDQNHLFRRHTKSWSTKCLLCCISGQMGSQTTWIHLSRHCRSWPGPCRKPYTNPTG